MTIQEIKAQLAENKAKAEKIIAEAELKNAEYKNFCKQVNQELGQLGIANQQLIGRLAQAEEQEKLEENDSPHQRA